jgi:hypothetical protein
VAVAPANISESRLATADPAAEPPMEIAPVAGAVGRETSLPIDLVNRKPDSQRRPITLDYGSEEPVQRAAPEPEPHPEPEDEVRELRRVRAVPMASPEPQVEEDLTTPAFKPRWGLRLVSLLLVAAAAASGYVFRGALRVEWRHIHAFARLALSRLLHH